ncbi:similar to Saccharomyces cerevisiae YGR284C ERV29 Protein localized to COPII-coated vesicles, involved in vesicle formation and incorporation of specific secretory cargo [Maudiozyma saulgeensis]|uniref:Similar to Saccharomyces cerevisiae YGR284C ERV29 Protein localized to COPII-coated vesicles, involved in vesicle formation and incorporation of specific secretory cargo n=1 Tax=Maudiozyma saulgeensis TaxID=1789683 RepID=A0A1X7R415_9SACH|nr:similar to Saccharomyces cerevisiae YGR284C ERV29 Protein localized to COPII-coated vesicles, involved in vesicle formation and incorporation of specific secretory cargo [Kazachstania saulgeensis]
MSYRGPGEEPIPRQQQQQQEFRPTPFHVGNNNNNYGKSQPNQQPSSWQHKLKNVAVTFDKYTAPIEDLTTHPAVIAVRPFIPGIARFLIVATFLEDSLRIVTQWSDQVFYLNQWKHYNWFFVVLFLATVSLSMLVGTIMILARKHLNYATGLLVGCIVIQSLVYGLFSGSSFLLRNISVIGGLLIQFSDSIVQNKTTFGMLPELTDRNAVHKGYLLLAGRILIVLMFMAFTLKKSWFTVFITIINTMAFAVGYKTKLASIMLVAILTFYNVYLNNYWFYSDAQRDFLRYEFFQNLSIIGGLLLVTNTGAGTLSVDEKKKVY